MKGGKPTNGNDIEQCGAMDIHYLFGVAISFAVVGFSGLVVLLYNELVEKPRRLLNVLKKQGITGPPQNILLGNILEINKIRDAAAKADITQVPFSHNCGAILFPFFNKWRKQYGDVFVFSLGSTRIIHVTQPDMVREITTCTSLDLGKPSYQAKRQLGLLLGNGILTSNGAYWTHQRKIIAPELYMDKVKGMKNLISESAATLVNSWKSIVEAEGGAAEITIDQHMRMFSGEVISRACFGSNFAKGEEIFLKLRALQEAASKTTLSNAKIPGLRHLASKGKKEASYLEKEIRALILQVVKERTEAGYESDLLQKIIEGAKNSNLRPDDQFIVDNLKNIYLAGYETTAVAATWCLMLLASNPEWQDLVRAEILELCRGQIPNADMIHKMKLLSMVMNESLRLYPPVAVVSRQALKDMKFGGINVPKDVNIWTLVITLHTDPEIWGQDSYKFNPGRWANGISGACKFPYMYMPFGVGPRVCLGQNLALVELKILISLILTNFSFSLSPDYVHSPSLNLVIEPKHGVQLLLNKLCD